MWPADRWARRRPLQPQEGGQGLCRAPVPVGASQGLAVFHGHTVNGLRAQGAPGQWPLHCLFWSREVLPEFIFPRHRVPGVGTPAQKNESPVV